MNEILFEIYHPRPLDALGIWDFGGLQMKAYGLSTRGTQVTSEMIATAKQFIDGQVSERIAAMGDSNGLGFVIVHPGETGLTISAHWWVQGCVLCQHNFRHFYDDPKPLDTSLRPVVACIWELALISAETDAWRTHMMSGMPDRTAYLSAKPTIKAA